MNYVFKKLTLILFLLFFITSCGKNSQSKAHIKISLGNMTGIYSGGLFLSGKNIDTGEAFSDVITTLDFTKMISSGSWQFYAIMWTGANELTGSPKCANPTLVNISGDQATVNLHLTLADCMSPHYALNNSYYEFGRV